MGLSRLGGFQKQIYLIPHLKKKLASTNQFAKLLKLPIFYHPNIPVLLELEPGTCQCGNCLLGKEALIIIFYNYHTLMVKLLSAPMHLIMQFLSIYSFT